MAEYAKINAAGIKFSSFQEILDSLKNDWRATFGDDLDLSATSPDGMHVALEARTVFSIVQLLQDILSQFDINTAEGAWLDTLASFYGVSRNGLDDASLRKVLSESSVAGLATIEGMKTYLKKNLDKEVLVNTHETDPSVPERTVMVTVPTYFAGREDEVAQAIYECKAVGIPGVGNSQGKAKDGSVIKFSIPQPVRIFVSVDITDVSYGVSSDIDDSVKDVITSWASSNLKPGVNVSSGKIELPIYDIEGVDNVVVKVGLSASSVEERVVKIDNSSYATIDKADITVSLPEE
jgi:uncharacterized phage protein gp47/JayE